MLRTRLWMGALLIALAVGALVVDRWLAPWYPFLFVIILGLALLACRELLDLLRAAHPGGVKSETGEAPPDALCPPGWLCYTAVAAVVLANWPAHLLPAPAGREPWAWVAGAFAGVVLAAFLAEMATFREPGTSVPRMALAVWVVGYLGLLPSFFAQLRWLPGLATADDTTRGSLALALAIFVPKFGDTGAYFTGRLLGRHRMTPVLSPKKTWEGAAGAMVASVLTAVGLDALGPVLRGGVWAAVGFGLSVGLVGLLGDLAESLVKRDCRRKDASQVMPGFGGVLDVVDSVIFAAPVAYWWLAW
jgi:phosphatidate cytidylyltransferase